MGRNIYRFYFLYLLVHCNEESKVIAFIYVVVTSYENNAVAKGTERCAGGNQNFASVSHLTKVVLKFRRYNQLNEYVGTNAQNLFLEKSKIYVQ